MLQSITEIMESPTRIPDVPKFGPVLVLAPHTDDAELGCGASIARLVDAGVDVHIVAFSTAEASLPPGSHPDRLHHEFLRATETLGLTADHLVVYKYPVRELTYHRQEVLEALIKLRRELKPEVVFLPAGTDLHQDHQVVHLEGLRAFKDLTVWGYELPWNHVTFSAQAFIKLKLEHLERKWTALQCYASQLELGRPYFSREFIEGLARVRGTQVQEQFAEAFEVLRLKW